VFYVLHDSAFISVSVIFFALRNASAGWVIKNVALYFRPYLWQLMADFHNSFTDTLRLQFSIMWLLYIPPHRKCISTLPCEIWMKYACIMIITNKHFGKIEKNYFRSTLRWMICITLDCVGLTQFSVIRIIYRNVWSVFLIYLNVWYYC